MPRFVLGGAVGAALAYLFDPDNGRKRRKHAIKRTTKALHQTSRKGRAVGAKAQGLKEKATHRREQEKPQPDDVTLARKVESGQGLAGRLISAKKGIKNRMKGSDRLM